MAKDFSAFINRVEELGALPSVPTVLMDLLQRIRDESTSTDEIAGLIAAVWLFRRISVEEFQRDAQVQLHEVLALASD